MVNFVYQAQQKKQLDLVRAYQSQSLAGKYTNQANIIKEPSLGIIGSMAASIDEKNVKKE